MWSALVWRDWDESRLLSSWGNSCPCSFLSRPLHFVSTSFTFTQITLFHNHFWKQLCRFFKRVSQWHWRWRKLSKTWKHPILHSAPRRSSQFWQLRTKFRLGSSKWPLAPSDQAAFLLGGGAREPEKTSRNFWLWGSSYVTRQDTDTDSRARKYELVTKFEQILLWGKSVAWHTQEKPPNCLPKRFQLEAENLETESYYILYVLVWLSLIWLLFTLSLWIISRGDLLRSVPHIKSDVKIN